MYDSRYNKKFQPYTMERSYCVCPYAERFRVLRRPHCRQFGLPFRSVMELSAPSIPLFHFFGRLGCFTAGCCYGIGGFPVQLVEAAINLMIFAVIILVQNQDKLRGKTFCLYLLLYTSVRFVLEFYRGDPERGFIGPLSVSQWISALLFLAAVFYLRRLRKA